MLWRRGKHFVTTNGLGAATSMRVGNVVQIAGEWWRVTRHRPAYDGWGGIKVYGVRTHA